MIILDEIFNATSVLEALNLDKVAARKVLNKMYNNPDTQNIDRYLNVIKRLKTVPQ